MRTSNLEWSNINSVLNSDSCSKTWRFNTVNNKVLCLMVTTIKNATDPQAQYPTAAVVSSASITLISSTVNNPYSPFQSPWTNYCQVAFSFSRAKLIQGNAIFLLSASSTDRRRRRGEKFMLHPVCLTSHINRFISKCAMLHSFGLHIWYLETKHSTGTT